MATRKREAAKKAARRSKSAAEQGIDSARSVFARFLEKADPVASPVKLKKS